VFAIIGAAMEVHRTLGPGYLEAVYQAALAHELTLRGLRVELKAVTALHPKHKAQTINYLTATGLQVALLINFGADSLKYERFIH
jgi:hypothetical protein